MSNLNEQNDVQSDTHDSNSTNRENREFDLILYGATSFIGELTAQYLNEFLATDAAKAQEKIRWAIAGRDSDKLEKVKKDIGNTELPIVIANSNDMDSLDAMSKRTRLIISTVGPYLKFGQPLIEACSRNGTDYVDLTGEAIFIKDMMDAYQKMAQDSGARIVNSCGFDSIPSDLGVLHLQHLAKEKYATTCDTISMRVKAAKGGLSGGTYASMATIFEEVGTNKQRIKQIANPYLLNTDDKSPSVKQKSINTPQWDEKHQHWVAPFIMASINTRIVHRSNQLQAYAYGRDFKYDEAMWLPAGFKGRLMSYAITAGTAGFATGMMFKPSRDLIKDYLLPESGDGPDKNERDNGYFDLRFFGETANGDSIQTKVKGTRDPGYGSTCRMLAHSALCLLLDKADEQQQGGFWTPATAMGTPLIKRLENYADIYFEEV